MAGHRWEKLGTMASSRWKKLTCSNGQVGSADPMVWPAPLWALWLTARAQVLPNGTMFKCPGAGFKLASKDVQTYFSKDFDAQKIFLDF